MHEAYIELISAALDGELSAQEQQTLEQHLKTCPACAALYTEWSQQSDALRALDCDPPADLKDKILQGLPAQDAPKRRRIPFRWAALAGCAVLALVIGGTALRTGDNPSDLSGAGEPMFISAEEAGGAPVPYSDEAEDSLSFPASEGSAQPRVVGGDGMPVIPVPLQLTGGQAIRVSYGNVPVSDTALVIGSTDSLAQYLALFPADDLSILPARYDDAFFQDHTLVAAVVEAGSGSIRFSIPDQVVQDTVAYQFSIPEVGTDDMAAWLLLAEGDRSAEDGQRILLEGSAMQNENSIQ